MLLFDLDGTLIESNSIWEDVDLEFLGRHGLQSTEEYAQMVGHSIFPVAAQFTLDYFHLPGTVEELMAEWIQMAEARYRVVPMKEGAMDFLRQCADAGERMAMVTACESSLCRIALECHGLTGFFEEVILAEKMGLEKRDPRVFFNAAERLNVAPEACVMYEDAPKNCLAAKTAGMKVVGVYDRFYAKYEEEMHKTCDRYIKSFTELLV